MREDDGPNAGCFHVTEHDRARRRDAQLVGRADDIEPFLRIDFIRANNATHFVVENLGRRARQAAQSRVREVAEKAPIDFPSVFAPCVISSGENAWTCMSGAVSLTVRQISR